VKIITNRYINFFIIVCFSDLLYSVLLLPKISESTSSTKKIKNKILAILAAPEAMPPNPKIAAIMAKTIKIIVQRNMVMCIKGY